MRAKKLSPEKRLERATDVLIRAYNHSPSSISVEQLEKIEMVADDFCVPVDSLIIKFKEKRSQTNKGKIK